MWRIDYKQEKWWQGGEVGVGQWHGQSGSYCSGPSVTGQWGLDQNVSGRDEGR